MRRFLVALIALSVLGTTAPIASGDSTGASTGPTTLAAEKKKCKKGYVRKRKHGKFVCVKAKTTPKVTPHSGLDVLATPGTYKGTNGVTVTSSATAEGAHQISQGHFTGPNTLVLETAGASNVLTHGQRCAAQYTNASVVF
ncbi:MAG: hypothetical protein JJE35_09885 [Thermoleophilia bacterium]|nr:hypothetical protein [Thermoleophilia bacterium]